MRRTMIFTVLAALAAAALAPAVSASELVSDQLRARLVTEQAQVRPGDTVTIALAQDIALDWHTYWKNPGDSGQGPHLDWQLPDGASASDFRWPAPDRIPVGPLLNYGYSDKTAQLTEITVPPSWPAGTPFPVAADAEILVCADICIPIAGRLAIDVPTGEETIVDPAARDLFDATRAALPAPSPWQARITNGTEALSVAVAAAPGDLDRVTDAYFFAADWGLIEHAGKQAFSVSGDGLRVVAPKGQIAPGAAMSGVLALEVASGQGTVRYTYAMTDAPVTAGTVAPPVTAPAAAAPNAWLLIGLAIAGGLLLNLMPCVFPVLAIKALGLAKHADAPRRARAAGGLAYTLGVVASFVALAGALLAARAGGEAVGWGFQLQDPLIVGALAYVVTAVGLNLSGVFEISGRFAGAGNAWTAKGGTTGAFATGVLAAIVAAPCTAPFMAVAAGGALLLPVPAALAVFAALGLGLALPYLLLTLSPALARRLPRPGPWMASFRKVLAFPMYATAAWLIWVLDRQVGADATFLVLLGLVVMAAALALLPDGLGRHALRLRGAAAVILVAGAAALLGVAADTPAPARDAAADSELAEPFTAARFEQLRGAGTPVFVNMTAAWCITCKVNERVALSGDGFARTLADNGITYLQGDWTNRDPEITAFLERFGRAGVPLYVLFPKDGGTPVLLPQLLDPGALGRALGTIS